MWYGIINFCTGSDEIPLSPEETEEDFLGEGWMWNYWKKIGNNDKITGPIENDHYDGSHGVKDGTSNIFDSAIL